MDIFAVVIVWRFAYISGNGWPFSCSSLFSSLAATGKIKFILEKKTTAVQNYQ